MLGISLVFFLWQALDLPWAVWILLLWNVHAALASLALALAQNQLIWTRFSHYCYYSIVLANSLFPPIQKLILKNIRKIKDKFGSAELAELKLLTVLVYFILITVFLLATNSYSTTVTPDLYLNALIPYFTCESLGVGGNRNCQALLSEVQQPHLYNLSVAIVVLIGLLPLIVFIINCDFKLCIRYAKKFHTFATAAAIQLA